MFNDFVMTILGAIITAAFSVVGWVIKLIFTQLKEHEIKHDEHTKNLTEHRIFSAQNFATIPTVKETEDRIVAHLLRIEEKLDKKADKKSSND